MIITLPRSQPLRWVDISSYPPTYYNHDNTLLQDEGRYSDEPVIFTKKFHTADPIMVYLITDYTTVTLKVYDLANALVQTVSLIDVGAPLIGATAYYGIINTTALGGIYYAKLEFSGVGLSTFTYQCDYFDVDDYSDHVLLKYKGHDTAGIYYDNTTIEFCFRVAADMTGRESNVDIEKFEAYTTIIKNVRVRLKRVIPFKTDEIPRYECEKIELALSHKTVLLNEIEYVLLDEPKGEPIPYTQFYSVSCSIAEVDYENYTDLVTVSGGTAPVGDGLLSPDGIDTFSTDGIDSLKVY